MQQSHGIVCRAGFLITTVAATVWLVPDASGAVVLSASNIIVDGRANIFAAGHAIAPDLAGGGTQPGLFPPAFSFAPQQNLALVFSSVTGTASMSAIGPFDGPDGGVGSGTTQIFSLGGISGLIATDRYGPLVGVFLSDAEPVDPAPPRLDFTGNVDFISLSPLLNQVFFIGDGRTASLQTQTFIVPSAATRFFLGFVDGDVFTHEPGFYSDNRGSLLANFTISTVPEPSGLLLWSLAIATLTQSRVGSVRRRAGTHHDHCA